MSRGAPADTIRLPLQVGTTAFWSLRRGAAILLPSFVVLAVVAAPLVWFMVEMNDVPDFIGKYVFIALLVPVIVVYMVVRSGVRALQAAFSERPSDLLLAGGELRIEGGPHHGFGAPIARARCTLVERTLKRAVGDALTATDLSLAGKVVATAVLASERRSLAALKKTVDALAGGHKAPAPEHRVEVVSCPSCGAPVALADAPRVACEHCHAEVPIAGDFRERFRALALVRSAVPKNERRLRSLLRQPSARAANVAFAVLGIPMLLAWPAVAVLAVLLARVGGLGVAAGASLGAAALTAVFAGFLLLSAWLVDRQALALVALHYGARPPAAAGEAATCRVCGAPLPGDAGTLFCACAYCGAENVLGLDVRGDASRIAQDQDSLMSAMERRTRDRWSFGAGALAALGALAGVGMLLRSTLHPLALSVQCRRGKGAACAELGRRLVADSRKETALALYNAGCGHGSAEACTAGVALAREIDLGFKLGNGDTLAALERACDRGVTSACTSAGAQLWTAVNPKPERARALLAKACDRRDGEGCRVLGELLEQRRGATPGEPMTVTRSREAHASFARACAAGSGAGCLDQAVYLATGAAGIGVDAPQAHALAARACKLGCSPACEQVACDGGDASKCVAVAIHYSSGDELTRDDAVAALLDRRGCDGGAAHGCSELGFLMEKGLGTPRDVAQGLTLYQRGCDGGDGEGCYNLGVAYGDGAGVAKDAAKADTLYQRACDLGYASGCSNLGYMIENGFGAPRDPAKAVSLYRRACDARDGLGCNNLAVAYEHGTGGVAVDGDRASSLFKKACDLGYRKACD